jgi:thioredoxin-like negative regulator of GroEL
MVAIHGSRSFAFVTLIVVLLRPVYSRLGKGVSSMAVTQLDPNSIEGYMQRNPKVIVDFYDDPEQQAELSQALTIVREYGSQTAFAKVDAAAHPELAKKFVPNGRFPQLVWFHHGEPTSYHRRLRQAQHIASFAIALDRQPMMTVTSVDEVPFNPAVFAQVPKSSPMFKILEVVALKHMDTVAFAHQETRGQNVSWLYNDEFVETYTGEATVEDVEHWVNTRLTISEDLPEDNFAMDDNEVHMVVGKTFEDMVLKNDKDVFLMVYAPWVGYSRKLFPVWKEFAREVADAEHLMVAKMDGDRNRSPLLNVDAFPSLMYFKAGNSTPNVFHGNRTVEELVDFANAHGSKPLLPASLNLLQKGFKLQRSRLADL